MRGVRFALPVTKTLHVVLGKEPLKLIWTEVLKRVLCLRLLIDMQEPRFYRSCLQPDRRASKSTTVIRAQLQKIQGRASNGPKLHCDLRSAL